MHIADLFPGTAQPFSCWFFCRFDETTIGDEILDTGEPVDIVYLIKNDKAEDSSDTRYGLDAEVWICIMSLVVEKEL